MSDVASIQFPPVLDHLLLQTDGRRHVGNTQRLKIAELLPGLYQLGSGLALSDWSVWLADRTIRSSRG